MDKRTIVIHGIILATSFVQAKHQFNTFCKGTPESRNNKDNIWFTKCCKSASVPGNFKSLIGKPVTQLPQEDFDDAEFVIAKCKLYDAKAKNVAKNLYPTLLAWKVAATRKV